MQKYCGQFEQFWPIALSVRAMVFLNSLSECSVVIAKFFNLKELLLAKLKSSDFFVTCYDESLNRVLQEEQMDVVLRHFKMSLAWLRSVILILLF